MIVDEWAKEKYARIGIMEAVARYTVGINVSLALTKPSRFPSWGTGTLLKIKDRLFIGTCKHVVRPKYRNEDLRVLYRSNAALQHAEKEEVKRQPLNRLSRESNITFAQEISVIKRFYSDEMDDLVVLELDSLSENINGPQFFTLTDTTLKILNVDMVVYLMEFSAELARQVTKQGDFGIFPYFESSKVVSANTNIRDFNPKRHFLTDFTITEDSVDPHGLSGCGVWTRLPSGKDNLWTPNLRLVGIQRGHYSKYQVLKATRIERLLKLVE